MKVGRVIADWRKNRNMKQFELADMTEIPVTVLSRIENGKRVPSIKHIQKIAKSLNVPAPILMFLSMEKDEIPENKRAEFVKIHNDYKSLIDEFFL